MFKGEIMKKVFLIIGIIVIVACIFSLIYAFLNMYGYRNILDGSPTLYDRLHKKTLIYAAIGVILALFGTLFFVLRRKLW